MRLHEEVGAVRREVELDCGLDEAWSRVCELSWLEEPATIEEAEPPRRLTISWDDDPSTVVDIALEPVTDDVTRVVVVEAPVEALRLAPAGPLLLAAA
jgi:uncharacterized protein YndB with AHSA1/START domain